MARHARADDPTDQVTPLRLVDPEPPDDDFAPEVRAVLDAVAALHSAIIGWAATTAGASSAPPPSGRHRR